MESWFLPSVELEGVDFLVDVGPREFRRADNPDERVWFYSKEGREMVRSMAGTQWRRHGLDNLPAEHCSMCGQGIQTEG